METKEYQKFQQKFDLPAYDELDRLFSISDIESAPILPKIRRKIYDKVESYSKLLASIIQPDTTLEDMYETKHFSDKEKSNAYQLYKKLVFLLRLASVTALSNSEEDNAHYIKKAYGVWETIMPQLKILIKKMADVWTTESNIQEDHSYFG